MSFDEESANDFLSGSVDFNEDKAADFLSGKAEIAETVVDPELELETGEKSIWQSAGDWAAGANDAIIGTLGLPGDAYNWVSEKLGSDSRVVGTEEVREGLADIGAGYGVGNEPDTAAYKAGNYTGTGLLFLAPWLKAGKGAVEAAKGGEAVQAITGTGEAIKTTGVTRGVAQRITAPFVAAPKTAYAGEIAGGTAAGLGAYYGKESYGQTGEMIGGLAGGMAPQPFLSNLSRITNYAKKSIFPYTKTGGKVKAAQRLRTLAETVNIEETIAREQSKVLQDAKISPAKLSGDRHMLALEKAVLKDDPELYHEFKMDQANVNALARKEVEELGGSVPIEQTQAYLQGRVDHIKKLINQSVTNAVTKSQRSMETLAPSQRRKVANQVVSKQIDDALTKSRAVEKEAWESVDKTAKSTTANLKQAFASHLRDRTKASDPDEIPSYAVTMLGKLKNGTLQGGKYKPEETVKELTSFRSRLLNNIRVEKAKDAPNWNKVRILNDLQDSVLKDIESSTSSNQVMEALTISRELNERFSGGVMNAIMGHEKTGGKLASELTLEAIKKGPKAAVEINRILAASPKSLDAVEEYVKIQIAQSNVVKNGRINLPAAKKYMIDNEDVMDIFPDLKRAMNHAIGAEERAVGMTATAAKRMKGVESSMAGKLAASKPGRVLTEIMSSPNPDVAMKKIVSQSNNRGREGLKNDIADYLLGKSKTGQFDEIGSPVLSGRKFANELKINEKVFSKALSKDEMKRLNIIAETMIKNEGIKELPDVGGVIEANRTPLSWALEVVAVRAGSKMGAGTHGAALKTAQMAGNVSRKILGDIDTGRARQLIKDAIQDPELFKALITDHTTQAQIQRFAKLYHGWLMAHAMQNIDENN
jgi:hypothetical protein